MAAAVKFTAVAVANGYKNFDNDTTATGSNLVEVDIQSTDNRNEIQSPEDVNVMYQPLGEFRVPEDIEFREAAIYLEEGKNNDKFDSHPHSKRELPAYLMVHNKWYFRLDLITSMVLLSLALCENPAVPAFKIPVLAHVLIELLALMVIGVELALKIRWIGWMTMLKHKRTVVKGVTLCVMFVEAMVVLFRQSAHFRVTRALRPIFLIDTHQFGGVRRFIRQIFQSLPPIFDMLFLILFFVVTYSVLGFFLFSTDTNDTNFTTLYDSVVSMFVLLTTANFPDVMMPSYSRNRWYSLFFISYLCIVLYILMNMMLAVVYEVFTSLEKEKIKKLYMHKHKACQYAYKMLCAQPGRLYFDEFLQLMRYYTPEKSPRDVVVMFKYLNKTGTGYLTQQEFYSIYDAVMMKWIPQRSNTPWYSSFKTPFQTLCQLCYNISSNEHFESFFQCMNILNLVCMMDRAVYYFDHTDLVLSAHMFAGCLDTCIFSLIFAIEVFMKYLAVGDSQFCTSGWNIFDLWSTIGMAIASIVLNIWPEFVYVAVLRPIKVFRLFKMKKRYRDIIGTVALLTPLIKSAFIVMIVVYYFFAIIGMELFSGYDMRDCCKGTVVEDFYQYKGTDNETSSLGYYYLNTFENIAISAVTLFELTVVNNWFIVMNGYAAVIHPVTRIYFIMFYLFTMVVLTIVVASILEAFRFRIQYKKQTTKKDEEKLLHEEVDIKWSEAISMVRHANQYHEWRAETLVGGSETATFIGCRPRNREVLQQRMYRAEIENWLKEADQQIS